MNTEEPLLVPCPNHLGDPIYAFYMQAILLVMWLLFYHMHPE